MGSSAYVRTANLVKTVVQAKAAKLVKTANLAKAPNQAKTAKCLSATSLWGLNSGGCSYLYRGLVPDCGGRDFVLDGGCSRCVSGCLPGSLSSGGALVPVPAPDFGPGFGCAAAPETDSGSGFGRAPDFGPGTGRVVGPGFVPVLELRFAWARKWVFPG